MSRTPYVNNMAGQTRGVKELVALAGAHPLSPECDHFYFLRHGQTPRNALRIFQGYDEPLSELGLEQAALAATVLAGEPIRTIVTSDARRAFDTAHASTELRWFGQEIFEQSQARGPLTDPAYVAARQSATSIARQAIDSTLAKDDLDAIIAPTNSPAWRTTLGQGDAFVLGSSSPSAISGYPNLTVPGGYAGPLPVGVSFIGRQWDEAGLLSLGYAWEQGSKVRRKPEYLRSIG